MRKLSVKWEPDYWREHNLPDNGCFGYVNGHLILGRAHHQLIMGNFLYKGWTMEQLFMAPQAWGWFTVNPIQYYNQYFPNMDKMKDWQRDSSFVLAQFTSDAGLQMDEEVQKALGAFSAKYHLPARLDVDSKVRGVVEENFASGLRGLNNMDKYLEKPEYYFGEDFIGNNPHVLHGVPQPPESDWNSEWSESAIKPEDQNKQEPKKPQKVKPLTLKGDFSQYNVGDKIKIIFDGWNNIETITHINPHDVHAVDENGNEHVWSQPSSIQKLAPEEDALYGIYDLKGVDTILDYVGPGEGYWINEQYGTKHKVHDLNLVPKWIEEGQIIKREQPVTDNFKEPKTVIGPNTPLDGPQVGDEFYYTPDMSMENPQVYTVSEVSPSKVRITWPKQLSPEGVGYGIDTFNKVFTKKPPATDAASGPFAGYEGEYQHGESGGSTLILDTNKAMWSGGSPTALKPETIINSINTGGLKKISVWKEAYTPGGKTKGWGDIMEKANYIRSQNGVNIINNEPQHVTGTVMSATDPQSRGPYNTEIWRDDPQSQAITMWDCDCDWDQYAWGRTRQWKKYEGRPCCHVLAMFWDALSNPPAGAQTPGTPAAPPTPVPGGGVTVNQGLIAPMGQPPIPNVPLIGPEGEPAPISPAPAPGGPTNPAALPWSEVVQPGKGEGTITFPGTFSHWKEDSKEAAWKEAGPYENFTEGLKDLPEVTSDENPEAESPKTHFQNGDIVRTWEETQGYAQPAYGQPGYPVTIKKNQSGEVLFSDDESTVAIFPLKTGPLEHHLVKVECPTTNLYLDNTNAQPFVKKH